MLNCARFELGAMVRFAGKLPVSEVCPFTSSQEFALVAVAVKVVAEPVLDAVMLTAWGRFPPVLYVHGTDDWLSCRLPVPTTSKRTGISSVVPPTVTLSTPK